MFTGAADSTENVSKEFGTFSDHTTKHQLLNVKEPKSNTTEVANVAVPDRSAKQLLLGATATVAKRIGAISDKSTKHRLLKIRVSRPKPLPNPEESGYDNALLARLQSVYPLERIRQSNPIGWRYWLQGRDSNLRSSSRDYNSVDLGSTQFWSMMLNRTQNAYVPPNHNAYKTLPYNPMIGIELESSLVAGSQRTKAVGDYVLRNQPDLAHWAQKDKCHSYDNGYGYGNNHENGSTYEYATDEALPTGRRIEMK